MPENNQTPEPNLLDAVNEATEHKTETKGATSFEWNFDKEEPEETTPDKNPTTTTTTIKPDTESTLTTLDQKTKTPITDKVKTESAKTAVGMLDILQQTIFTPIISYKYSKKFTEPEVTRLDETDIIDADKKNLIDDDLRLRNKWERIMKKCNRKLDSIPLDDAEKKSLESNFYTYFDVKQKSLPVEWLIGFAIINSIGKRTIDIFTE